MEAPEYLDLDEIDFSDDISVSITTYKQYFHSVLPSCLWAAFFVLSVFVKSVFPWLSQLHLWTESKLC